jgi:S-adenosylmethionine:tRNA ribosyltransferase-isomerase
VRRDRPGSWDERAFHELPDLLRQGDVLVRNTTRVLPARLAASKEGSGARCEVLLLEPEANGESWWALVRPGRRLGAGSRLRLADGTRLEVRAQAPDGRRLVAVLPACDLAEVARRVGCVPLPPYIRRPADAADHGDYQTVYADRDGSVAAPTAGLHFTPALLASIAAGGVAVADLVLHVGLGTFQPSREHPLEHRMHTEPFEIAAATLERIDAARRAGGRVVAVGTTVVRVLESIAAWESGAAPDAVQVEATRTGLRGRTRLFLHPPHDFRRVDALVTNFHLPRSSLLLLVDAFAGRETVRAAYRHAVDSRFRFFSYGDAMWIE